MASSSATCASCGINRSHTKRSRASINCLSVSRSKLMLRCCFYFSDEHLLCVASFICNARASLHCSPAK